MIRANRPRSSKLILAILLIIDLEAATCNFELENTGEHSGDHNHQDFPQSIAMQMGGVLQYKWEAYCDTNERPTDGISLSPQHRGTKSTAIQIGGVLQYKLEVYCNTILAETITK